MPASESTPLASIPAALRRSSSSPRPQPTSSTGPRPSSSGTYGSISSATRSRGPRKTSSKRRYASPSSAAAASRRKPSTRPARSSSKTLRPSPAMYGAARAPTISSCSWRWASSTRGTSPSAVASWTPRRPRRSSWWRVSASSAAADLVEPALDAGLLARPGGAVAVELEREPPQRRREREVELPLGGRVRAQRAEQRAPRGALRPAAAAAAEVEGEPVLEVTARERRPGRRGRRALAAAADPDEPLARDRADRLGAQPGGDVGGGARTARGGRRTVAVDLAQRGGGVLERGLGPDPLLRVVLGLGPDLGQRPVDEVGVRRRHEVGVAGVAGGDHGLAERHRLRQRQAVALGAVQRHVGVGALEQRGHLGGLEHRVHEPDVVAVADRVPQPLARLGAVLRVDRLEQQRRALAGLERALERLDQPERVLALERREEVEREQEHEAVRQLERHRRAVRVGLRHRQRHDDHGHADVGRAREVLGDVARVDPDLVDEVERRVPPGRHRVGLPRPLPDRVARAQRLLARLLGELADLLGVDAQQVDGGLAAVGHRDLGELPLLGRDGPRAALLDREPRRSVEVATGTPAACSALV